MELKKRKNSGKGNSRIGKTFRRQKFAQSMAKNLSSSEGHESVFFKKLEKENALRYCVRLKVWMGKDVDN